MAIRRRGYRPGTRRTTHGATARAARRHGTSGGSRQWTVTRFPDNWYRMDSREVVKRLDAGLTPRRMLGTRAARSVAPLTRVMRRLGYYGSNR